MPLLLLGLVFVVGLFAFYLFSTSGNKKKEEEKKKADDLKKEENVIFLPDDLESIKQKRRKNK